MERWRAAWIPPLGLLRAFERQGVSHNHRMLGIGRALERLSSPILLQQQEHLGEVPSTYL